MEMRFQSGLTSKDLPPEIKEFFLNLKQEHLSKLENNQLIQLVSISVDMNLNKATIHTESSNFIFDKTKGLEQFI